VNEYPDFFYIMKRVLIVTPNWPPISCPDIHRVRMSLPYFHELGWEALILKIDPDQQEGLKDKTLENTVPPDIQTWQAGCLDKFWTQWFGLNSVGFRSFFHLAELGSRIIKTAKPDLIFFSTTMFVVMSLGRYWHKRHNIPYMLDFQDPWVNDYQGWGAAMPGGKIKFQLSQAIAKHLESFTLREVSHIISVSPGYPKTLQKRYSWLRQDQFTVLPFGAPETDFELLPSLNIQQKIFDPSDGKRHWVYVGRGGSDMALALRALFSAIKLLRDHNPEIWETVKLHFVGTSYAPGDRAVKTIEPIAQEMGVADLVAEHTHRIGYFEALQTLMDSNAILMIGSDDPNYTASKLYPCVLARKPIFAIFHEQSSVVDILRQCQAGKAVTFASNNQPQDLHENIISQLNWLLGLAIKHQPQTIWSAFEPYTAREMTRQQCLTFNQCLANK
jgi:hypothetical protein